MLYLKKINRQLNISVDQLDQASERAYYLILTDGQTWKSANPKSLKNAKKEI